MLALIGAILLGLGLFLLVKTIEMGEGDKATFKFFFVSLGLILTGGWLLLTNITLAVLLRKLGGLSAILIGFFFAFKFPGHADYGVGEYVNLSMLIGFILLVVGVWLLLF